jgi:single-strand DNA-binding protein
MIIGNCGKDADLRYTAGGTAAASFSVAVNSNRRNPSGEWETETEWFSVTLFGDTAERMSQYITKGKSIYVEGSLRTRSWDDDQGVRHTRTEVIGQRVQLLDRRERDDSGGDGGGWSGADRPQRSGNAGNAGGSWGGGQQRGGGAPARGGFGGGSQEPADDIDDLPFE